MKKPPDTLAEFVVFVATMGLGLTVVMVVIAAVSLFGLWLVKACERIA